MQEPTSLEMSPDEMRRAGYRVIDMLVERWSSLRGQPVWSGASRAELDARIAAPPPAAPSPFGDVLQRLADDVLPFNARIDHPRFLAFVPGTPTWPSIMGDLVASGSNIFQGTWLASSGASALELTVIDWFREWLGLPAGAGGLLVSGGSVANLTALACARSTRFGAHHASAVIYCSAETHSSVPRAARVLGFADDRIRHIAVDEGDRIVVAELEAAIMRDRAAGLEPFLVVANGGTTSTGAIDALTDIADVCTKHDLWLHVDAAYGGFAILTERGRPALAGIERADSVTLDPHKWLYQGFEAGCLLVRDARLLEQAFAVMPPYLQDTAVPTADAVSDPSLTRLPVNFANRGIQLTRGSRALKIWMSIQTFGTRAFADAIDQCVDLALHAQQRIEQSGTLELITPARLGIVCFRRRCPGDEPAHDQLNATLLRALLDSGAAMISSTRVRDAFALRFCVLNYRTSRNDIDEVIDWIENFSGNP